MIVIAIIGILAAIAIPNFISYRQRAYNSASKADAKNAYTAAQAYFTDYPALTADITQTALESAGFRKSDATQLTVGGTVSSLSIEVTHPRGNVTYSVGPDGSITTS